MSHFKVFTFFIVFVLSYSGVFSQLPDYYRNKDTINIGNSGNQSKGINFLKNNPKVRTSLEMGTSIGTFSGHGTCFSTFVSPFVSTQLSDRFTIDLGFTSSRGNMLNTYDPYYGEVNFPVNGTMYQNLVFARGKYLLNDKVTVFGTAAYGMMNIKSDHNGEKSVCEVKEFSFGAEYKLSENSRISIEVRNISGNSPFQSFTTQDTPLRSTPGF